MLERLRGDEADLAEQVIHAALPRGQNFEPVRQFGQMYSFWRDVPVREWSADNERRLFTGTQLKRSRRRSSYRDSCSTTATASSTPAA